MPDLDYDHLSRTDSATHTDLKARLQRLLDLMGQKPPSLPTCMANAQKLANRVRQFTDGLKSVGADGTAFELATRRACGWVAVELLQMGKHATGEWVQSWIAVHGCFAPEVWQDVQKGVKRFGTAVLAAVAPITPRRRSRPARKLAVKNGEVLLDGEPVPLDFTPEKKEDAMAFFRQVIGQRGGWISGPEIGLNEGREGARFDRVYHHKNMPPQVKALIVSDRRKGYRLRPPNNH
jgi:hypothetical protein